VKELSQEDTRDVAVSDRPSWPQEGRLRHEQKDSHLIGRSGVVDITFIANSAVDSQPPRLRQ
jgi:hypothetical protein